MNYLKPYLFLAAVSAGTAFGTDEAGIHTEVRYMDFGRCRVEMTVDAMPRIRRLRILTPPESGATNWAVALDKTDFCDWGYTMEPRYYGISQMGEDLDIFTMETGTGMAAYFIHKYRFTEEGLALVTSTGIYSWTAIWPECEFEAGEKKAFLIRQDPERPWTISLETAGTAPPNARQD